MFIKKASELINDPLKLTRLSRRNFSPKAIYRLLKKGIPIWGYLNLKCPSDFLTTVRFSTCSSGGYGVFRKEYGYLCMYIAHFDRQNKIHLKLSEVCRLDPKNAEKYFNRYIKNFNCLYKDDVHFTESTLCYAHDVTLNLIEEELKDNPIFYVGDEHFYMKKDCL